MAVPVTRLPTHTLMLDRPGMARAISLPFDRDEFSSSILSSYRVKQGVLHNPRSDRRTTQGIFHVTEGGLPIPDDKMAVPKAVFAKLLGVALNPPRDLLRLPFTSTQPQPAECFVSPLLLRPVVSPAVTRGIGMWHGGQIMKKNILLLFIIIGIIACSIIYVLLMAYY